MLTALLSPYAGMDLPVQTMKYAVAQLLLHLNARKRLVGMVAQLMISADVPLRLLNSQRLSLLTTTSYQVALKGMIILLLNAYLMLIHTCLKTCIHGGLKKDLSMDKVLNIQGQISLQITQDLMIGLLSDAAMRREGSPLRVAHLA